MRAPPARAVRRILGFAATLALLVFGWWLWTGSGAQPAPQGMRERTTCAMPAEAPTNPHPGMRWVPGGSFDFGDTLYPEEQPLRRVSVEGFWIDRTEVSNAQFAEFVDATGHLTDAERVVDAQRNPGLPPEMRKPGAVVFVMPGATSGHANITQWWRYVPGANWRHPGGPHTSIAGRAAYPVVAVTYADALAYARWKGRALPSEAQWEWAARAARPLAAGSREQPADANTWQGLFPVHNSADDGFIGLAPVGCYPANALGLFDMIGNVWELTADAWTANHAEQHGGAVPQAARGMRLAAAPAQRVIKGGSFLCAPSYCMRYRPGSRQPQEDDLGVSHVGFRTIIAAPGP